MEAVCNRAIIIAEGRIVVDTTPERLAAMSRFHNAVTLRTQAAAEALDDRLRAVPGVASVEHTAAADGRSAEYAIFPEPDRVILPDITRFLEQNHIEFDEVFAEKGRVDEVFRRVTLGGA